MWGICSRWFQSRQFPVLPVWTIDTVVAICSSSALLSGSLVPCCAQWRSGRTYWCPESVPSGGDGRRSIPAAAETGPRLQPVSIFSRL